MREPCTAWRLAVGCALPGGDDKIGGSGSALVPGGGEVVLGGMDFFCLAALGVASGGNPTTLTCLVLRLSNDAILGSGDAVP